MQVCRGVEGTIWEEEWVHPFPEEQDQARLHLRMGGRGGAPRAAEKKTNKNHIHKLTHQTLNNPNNSEIRDRLFKLTFNFKGLGFLKKMQMRRSKSELKKRHQFYFLSNYGKSFMTTLLTSVCFAGIYSLKVFIFFWSRKVFYWMERILRLKIIYKRNRILICASLLLAPNPLQHLNFPSLASVHSDVHENLPCPLKPSSWGQQ